MCVGWISSCSLGRCRISVSMPPRSTFQLRTLDIGLDEVEGVDRLACAKRLEGGHLDRQPARDAELGRVRPGLGGARREEGHVRARAAHPSWHAHSATQATLGNCVAVGVDRTVVAEQPRPGPQHAKHAGLWLDAVDATVTTARCRRQRVQAVLRAAVDADIAGGRQATKAEDTAVLAEPDGTFNRHRKTHLYLGSRPCSHAGNETVTVAGAAGHLGVLICFEHAFPELAYDYVTRLREDASGYQVVYRAP